MNNELWKNHFFAFWNVLKSTFSFDLYVRKTFWTWLKFLVFTIRIHENFRNSSRLSFSPSGFDILSTRYQKEKKNTFWIIHNTVCKVEKKWSIFLELLKWETTELENVGVSSDKSYSFVIQKMELFSWTEQNKIAVKGRYGVARRIAIIRGVCFRV